MKDINRDNPLELSYADAVDLIMDKYKSWDTEKADYQLSKALDNTDGPITWRVLAEVLEGEFGVVFGEY